MKASTHIDKLRVQQTHGIDVGSGHNLPVDQVRAELQFTREDIHALAHGLRHGNAWPGFAPCRDVIPGCDVIALALGENDTRGLQNADTMASQGAALGQHELAHAVDRVAAPQAAEVVDLLGGPARLGAHGAL